jgi:hypothetical protein
MDVHLEPGDNIMNSDEDMCGLSVIAAKLSPSHANEIQLYHNE